MKRRCKIAIWAVAVALAAGSSWASTSATYSPIDPSWAPTSTTPGKKRIGYLASYSLIDPSWAPVSTTLGKKTTFGKKKVAHYLAEHSLVDRCVPTETKGLNRCPNGLSFEQEERHLFGEGLCGPVAVANVLINYHKWEDIDPEKAALLMCLLRPDKCKGGLIRGSSAKDVQRTLMHVVEKTMIGTRYGWEVERSQVDLKEQSDTKAIEWFIRPYREQKHVPAIPVVVPLGTHPDVPGHWTTVTGIENGADGCRVIHLTWGTQFRTTCRVFEWLMKNRKGVVYLARTGETPSVL